MVLLNACDVFEKAMYSQVNTEVAEVDWPAQDSMECDLVAPGRGFRGEGTMLM